MRRQIFAIDQYYHIFNRGVEKRDIFMDRFDAKRFIESMHEFNSLENIGSLYAIKFDPQKKTLENSTQLVSIIAYCLNPNHYHLILQPKIENGISMYMKKLGGGYSRYFNERYKRAGSLFAGSFKAVHIENNERLLHVSAYVNLNNKVHKLSDPVIKSLSSWGEYTSEGIKGICDCGDILNQFSSKEEYREFAQYTLPSIIQKKDMEKENLYM